MEFVDEHGVPQGFDIEFTKRLMSRMDIPFTYAPNSWANIAGDVLNEGGPRHDGIFTVS